MVNAVFWDKAGSDFKIGRERRAIYIEWENPQNSYDSFVIDVTNFVDSYVEKVVVPNITEYLRRVPPLTLRRLRDW
jgi:hypothetical protein